MGGGTMQADKQWIYDGSLAMICQTVEDGCYS